MNAQYISKICKIEEKNGRCTMQSYVGMDYRRKSSYMTVVDEKGKLVRQGQVENSKEAVSEFLYKSQCNESSSAVLEATRNWTVMHDWLEELGGEVHLAHPLKVKAIAQAKIKTDKIDAKVLAHLLRTDLLPEAYVPTREARKIRNALRQRMFFVRLRTMVKNRIFGMLDRYPQILESRPCKDIFSLQGMAWLKQVPFKRYDRRIVDEDLDLMESLDQHIARSEKLVEELAFGDWRVELLRTIPGIGKFFALLIAYEVDEINRFRHEKKFFSYIGIVPSTFSSGARTFHGRITKQGNKYLRWAMIEAIWPAIRKDIDLRNYYERIKAKKGANPVKVATARKLATIVYKVLLRRRPYRISVPGLPS
jgi:transposase